MAARRICFTQNNWTDDSYRMLVEEEKFSYLILGKETGESGTNHLQGYAEFKKVTKWAPLAKKHRMHCETAKGTSEQAINYCKKDGDWAEFGEKKMEAKVGGDMEKERWARNLKLAEEGKLEELKDLDPAAYTRMYRTYKQIKVDSMKALPALDALDNYWYWGPPGTGKSTTARAQGNYYPKQLNKWWDGYQGEDVIIIDDWEKDCHLDHHLKIWADHFDFIGETKGGAIRIRPKKIIVTSNYSMEDCFQGEALEALKRRFKRVHFDKLSS